MPAATDAAAEMAALLGSMLGVRAVPRRLALLVGRIASRVGPMRLPQSRFHRGGGLLRGLLLHSRGHQVLPVRIAKKAVPIVDLRQGSSKPPRPSSLVSCGTGLVQKIKYARHGPGLMLFLPEPSTTLYENERDTGKVAGPNKAFAPHGI